MTVAVLALQGAFAEHIKMLKKIGADCFEVRQKRDILRHFDALILPGGESTTMGKLLRDLELYSPLRENILGGMPVFGTCAGMILLADKVAGGEVCFGTMDIEIKRNAYGRQLGSFHTEGSFRGIGTVPMTFIRAPYIEKVGEKAEALAVVDGRIAAARQGNQLAVAFHPELDGDSRIHEYFLKMIRE